MKGKQLELNLWEALQRAQQMPETIEVVQILDAMDVAAAQLSDTAQLQFAGEALLQIAELCAARAGLLLTEWEESYRDPIVAQGFFADVVRQTMAVDLSDLMEPAPPRKPRTKATGKAEGSIAAPVDKAAALALVDQLEVEAEAVLHRQVLTLAHDEDVSSWVGLIARCLQDTPSRKVSFVELYQQLDLTWVEVWLGVLLGGFKLEQYGEFYQALVWVQDRDEAVIDPEF